jgi:hypothetical protein
MADDSGHFGTPDLDDLHKQFRASDTTEGGACLTGHEANFRNFGHKVTCNYRYQCYEQADTEAKIKAKLHSYNVQAIKAKIVTSVYETEAGGWAPAYYCASLPIPEPGDWDVGGPNRTIYRKALNKKTKKIPQGKNFTQDTWPYWNNAHHLIPKALLRDKILGLEQDVSDLLQRALMSAQYNVNYKVNMFMMPQDKEVAAILGLTRHIQLKEKDSPGNAQNCTDHPGYTKVVEVRLARIIDSYNKICKDAIKKVNKKHPVPKPKVDKAKLHRLSKSLMNLVLAWGQLQPGASLDHIAKAIKKRVKP